MRLSESFFNEIVSHPVPLDLTTLKALKRSPLGLRSIPMVGLPDLPALTTAHNGSPGSRCTVSSAQTRPRPSDKDSPSKTSGAMFCAS